jgi:hypothetical protein
MKRLGGAPVQGAGGEGVCDGSGGGGRSRGGGTRHAPALRPAIIQ